MYNNAFFNFAENPVENILSICERNKNKFIKIVKKIDYEKRGIFNSELLMFVSLVSYLNPEIIIESGRARGFSTRVICEFFIDENKKIFSIEKDKYNRDFRYAENNLEYLYNKKCNFKKLLGKYIVSLKNKFYNYV